MKLFRISQRVNNDYDTYDSAVVRAADEESARRIHPGGDYHEWQQDIHYGSWVNDPSQVRVDYLGEAAPEDTEPGVIVASFNAG